MRCEVGRARPHAAAAACTGGATRKPSAKQARRRARTCRWPAQVASRLGGRGVYGVGQVTRADIARPRAACAPASRAQRQGRPKLLRMRGGGHTCGWCSEEVGLGDEVDCGVGRLARIIAPRRVHCDVCAWRVSSVWSGVCCGGAVVLISRGGWAKRAELGRRSHLELKRRLHLELKGVDLLFVERRQKGDDEW